MSDMEWTNTEDMSNDTFWTELIKAIEGKPEREGMHDFYDWLDYYYIPRKFNSSGEPCHMLVVSMTDAVASMGEYVKRGQEHGRVQGYAKGTDGRECYCVQLTDSSHSWKTWLWPISECVKYTPDSRDRLRMDMRGDIQDVWHRCKNTDEALELVDGWLERAFKLAKGD